MNPKILLSLFLCFNLFLTAQTNNTYESKLNEIARAFREDISDERLTEVHRNEAGNLAKEIHDAMYDTNDEAEERMLKRYEKEAEGLEDYISAVGNAGNYHPHKNEFYQANRRVGGVISYIGKNKYCVDVIAVSIDNYTAYLFENNSLSNYRVSYAFKTKNYGWKGNLGVMKNDLNHFHNNRASSNDKSVSMTTVKCTPF